MRAVDVNGFYVVISCDKAFDKAEQRFFGENMIIFGIDETNLIFDIVHISVGIGDENDIARRCVDTGVCHVDNSFSLARAFRAVNQMYQY